MLSFLHLMILTYSVFECYEKLYLNKIGYYYFYMLSTVHYTYIESNPRESILIASAVHTDNMRECK